MLFGKKKNEKANTEAVSEKVQEQEKIFQSVNSAVFSNRIAGVFGRIYRLILSADLSSNVCQIESGEARIGNDELLLRDRYDHFIHIVKTHFYKADAERFSRDFSAENLKKHLLGAESGFSSVYCMSDLKADDGSAEYKFYEVSADLIPADKDTSRVRCIIYFRQVKELYDGFEKLSTEGKSNLDINKARIEKLLGGTQTIFFEYDFQKDEMVIHYAQANGSANAVISAYMKNLELRSDWLIFHNDIKTVVNLLKDAMNGKNGNAEIKYRQNSDKNGQFRIHKLVCAPGEDTIPSNIVIGAITDIHDEAVVRQKSNDIKAQLEKMVSNEDSEIYEMDLDRDTIFRIVRTLDGYARENSIQRLSTYIAMLKANEIISPQSAGDYDKWFEMGYLERKTISGSFEFESCMRKDKNSEYRWYSETLSRMGQSRKFLRLVRDCTDRHEASSQAHIIQEKGRYDDYNRRMLDMMASMVEFRNLESTFHISNVRNLTRILLEDMMSRCPLYDLTPKDVELYSEAAILHDIGKIAISDAILNKNGKLTEEEFRIVKTHTTEGAKIIDKLNFPGQPELMNLGRQIALHHHERFDGSGYPDGLVGDQTPIGVQAVGLADVYDAMVSVRAYKKGVSHEEVSCMIINGELGSFNPKLIESFKACKELFHAAYIKEENK